MIIKLIFEDDTLDKQLSEYLQDKNVTYIPYNLKYGRDRRKAFKIKGYCSAKQDPFCVIYDDNEAIQNAFYSEVNDCTFENIKEYLESCNLK